MEANLMYEYNERDERGTPVLVHIFGFLFLGPLYIFILAARAGRRA